MKIAIISTYLPQQCGIATFANDLYNSLQLTAEDSIHIIALSDTDHEKYPLEVSHTIEKHHLNSYLITADIINKNYDLCVIQHEYGIFGGDCGEYIVSLLHHLHLPIITNFHTILPKPSPKEKAILTALGQLSTIITVMTNWAVNMLHSIYQLPTDKIVMIPHGVPVFDYDQEKAKQKLGLQNKKILLSFGFLGRGKGFETAIDATQYIEREDFVYIILGVTHPNVIKEEGEFYRNTLIEKCKDLGLEDKVQFKNEFATPELLNDYLSACDIYVTPYPNENQISSGTLSYAMGAGAALVSTPYLYAKDLLAEDRGLFFDFNDSLQLSAIVNQLLDNPQILHHYRAIARSQGNKMQWKNVGRTYSKLIQTTYNSNTKLFKRA